MINPVLFPQPRSTRNWASKAVFGERAWSEWARLAIPSEFHSPVPNIANAYATIGVVLLTYGLIRLQIFPVVTGIVIAHGGKAWCLDRMVLLFEAVKRKHSDYADLEYERR